MTRSRALTDCCSWSNTGADQAFFTVKYQQELAEYEVQRADLVISPLELHEKLRMHYQRQLTKGRPHAKVSQGAANLARRPRA